MELELVSRNSKTNKLYITDQAKTKLESINEPFGVLGIVGPKRAGKSTLLNFLAQNKNIFQVGSTTEPVTKGLKMCPDLIRTNGKISYFLLDSEGTYSFESSAAQDIEILALMYLFVNMFILNTKGGGIDQTDLNLLSTLVTTINKLKEKNKDFNLPFPNLIWIIRDFNLKLQQNGKEITGKEYLDTVLKSKSLFSYASTSSSSSFSTSSSSPSSLSSNQLKKRKRSMIESKTETEQEEQQEEKQSYPTTTIMTPNPSSNSSFKKSQNGNNGYDHHNKKNKKTKEKKYDEIKIKSTTTPVELDTSAEEMKNVIHKNFKSFNLFPLCFPTGDPKILQNPLHLETSKKKLNSEFTMKISEIKSFVTNQMEEMTYCGRPLSGSIFYLLLSKAVEAINNGELPVMKNSYRLAIEISCKDGLLQGKNIFYKISPLIEKYIHHNCTSITILNLFFLKFKHFLQTTYFRICYSKKDRLSKEHVQEMNSLVQQLEQKILILNKELLQKHFNYLLDPFFSSSSSSCSSSFSSCNRLNNHCDNNNNNNNNPINGNNNNNNNNNNGNNNNELTTKSNSLCSTILSLFDYLKEDNKRFEKIFLSFEEDTKKKFQVFISHLEYPFLDLNIEEISSCYETQSLWFQILQEKMILENNKIYQNIEIQLLANDRKCEEYKIQELEYKKKINEFENHFIRIGKEKENLKTIIEEKKTEIIKFIHDLEDLKHRMDLLQHENEIKTTNIKTLNDEARKLGSLEAENNTLKVELEAMMKYNKDFETQLNAQKSTYQEEFVYFQKEISKAKIKEEELQNQLNKLINSYENKIKDNQEQMKTLTINFTNIKEKHEMCDKIFKLKDKEYQEIKQKVEENQKLCFQKMEEINTLQKQFIEEKEQLHSQNQTLEQEKHKIEFTMEQLKEKIKEFRNNEHKYIDLTQAYNTLIKEKHRYEMECQTYKDKCNETLRVNKELRDQILYLQANKSLPFLYSNSKTTETSYPFKVPKD